MKATDGCEEFRGGQVLEMIGVLDDGGEGVFVEELCFV
jgi:hypothetical protein